MSRIDNVKRGIVFGVLNNIVNILLPFISRTVVIYVLGTEFAGLGGLFTSIVNVLNISELGFGAAVSYVLYEPMASEDFEKIRKILHFTQRVFRIIGLIVLGIGIILIPFLPYLISSDYPASINIYYLYILFLCNSVISYFAFSYKRILFSAGQRYDVETNIATFSILLQYIFQIFSLVVWRNYYIYVSISVIMTLVNNILCGYITKKMYPECYSEGNIDKEDVKLITKQVGGAFFSKIGSTVYLSVDNIVISAIFGLLILGQYGNYYYVVSALVAVFAVINNTVRPVYGNCIVLESVEQNYERYCIFNYLYLWLSGFCCCCLLCLFQDLIKLWVGIDNCLPNLLVILLVIYFYVGRISYVPNLFVESAGLWWESKFVPLIAAVLNLGLNIWLSLSIGLSGVLISSIASSLIIMQTGYTFILFTNYFAEKSQLVIYVKNTIIITVCICICTGIVAWSSSFINVNDIFHFILKCLFVSSEFVVLFIILNFRTKYFQAAVGILKKMIRIRSI